MTAGRRGDLDNLKVALTALVLLHHLDISFGADGSWYFVATQAPHSLGLSIVNAIDQSFFMGLFFFVSGYFTPAAFDRKGPRRFLVERTRRLLLPVALFGLTIAPWLEHVKRLSLGRPTPPLAIYYFQRVAEWSEFDPGPLWFVWALWLFSLGYSLLRALRPPPPKRMFIRAADAQLLALALGIGVTSFAVRIVAPVGRDFLHIQLAYLPQYLWMFVAGAIVARHDLLASLGLERFARWLATAVTAALAGGFVFAVVAHGDAEALRGGIGVAALGWVLCEALCGTAISVCLLVGFGAWITGRSPISKTLAANAYAAFVVHAPIVVAVARGVSRTSLPPLFSLLASVTIGLPLTLGVAMLLRRVPGVARVL